MLKLKWPFKSENNKIFIQIASYRDPLLISTIEDAIKNAEYPDNLVFAICNQFHPEDDFGDLDPYRKDKRFRIYDYDISKAFSPGVCWARYTVQQLYNGEEYTLQIDSHMRFSPRWDTTLIEMYKGLKEKGYKKPLLTGYMPQFVPDNDPGGRVQQAWRMRFDRFIPEGALFFLPEEIPGWQSLDSPVPARFYSAHFAFTTGDFCKEVQHNPEYYFHGEEISITVRAYTWGYDLFHPHRPLIWHEYTREGRVKPWDADEDKNWGDKNKHSHLTNRKLFGMDGLEQEGHDGPYGFGPVRTLRDYEKYAGIHFATRSVQQYTLDGKYPPNPIIEDEKQWLDSMTRKFKHCIDIHTGSITEPIDDYDFWVVVFKDKEGNDLFRKDAIPSEIKSSLQGDFYRVWREFLTEEQPASWVVWPHSKTKEWMNTIEGNL